MRIVTGKYKGRKVKSPEDKGTHPMGEREKLALFNMLGNDLSGVVVLDAYAGSGALGIEALSRNAKKVVFVEKSPKVTWVIRENLKNIAPDDDYEVFCKDIAKFSEEYEGKFDLIIADPPYDHFEIKEVEKLIKVLKSGGILVLSYPKDEKIEFLGLKLQKNRNYAASGIAIFEKV